MKRLLTAIIASLMALTALFSFTACGSSGEKDLENVKAAGKIVVGMECAYAPYNWMQTSENDFTVKVDNNSFADGYDVQIAKKIAEELGVSLYIKPIEWDGLIPALNSEDIDLVIAGMSPTSERKKSIDFSDIYYESNLVMVVRKSADSKYTGATKISDFSGAKITGQLNTFHYDVIDQISGVAKQPALADFGALTTALKAGTIDGYVCERPGAISAVTAYPDDFMMIEFSEGNGFTCDPEESSISVGMRKNSSLCDIVNNALAKISNEQRVAMMDAAISRQPVSDN
ncbi:MAG: transporter substrate-binding domain-containing protein [Candidatus Borkfalkiaceae bacterium]|nr:transporter substrate-binding domain-containing protein [Christensenellaceae bacterium]